MRPALTILLLCALCVLARAQPPMPVAQRGLSAGSTNSPLAGTAYQPVAYAVALQMYGPNYQFTNLTLYVQRCTNLSCPQLWQDVYATNANQANLLGFFNPQLSTNMLVTPNASFLVTNAPQAAWYRIAYMYSAAPANSTNP